jgi:GNAT superfamily N-acetyltransferase
VTAGSWTHERSDRKRRKVFVDVAFGADGRRGEVPICQSTERRSREEVAMTITIRLATGDDVTVLVPLMEAAIEQLQRGFLDDDQIESSKAIMGIDRQLIDDGTYFVVEIDGTVAGCGGWSRRATLYGGDHSGGRDAALLDPTTDPARIRAMYTHPDFARRGVGRLVLEACEAAAAAEGFATLELMATRSGRPLYETHGFQPVEEVEDASGGAPVPLTRMRKPVTATAR